MSEQFRFAFHNSMVQARAKLLWPKRNRRRLGCLSSAFIRVHRLKQIRKVKVQTWRHRQARDARFLPLLGKISPTSGHASPCHLASIVSK
jgi:hypothetical protein